jgi:hypothetical protein
MCSDTHYLFVGSTPRAEVIMIGETGSGKPDGYFPTACGVATMTFTERLPVTHTGLGVALISIPVALLLTLLLVPFWSLLEAVSGIESLGHSGPAGWCVLVVYLLVVSIGGMIWSFVNRRKLNRTVRSDKHGRDHPVDIERALKAAYSTNTRQRNLQLEANAHITVQKWIDEGDLKDHTASVGTACTRRTNAFVNCCQRNCYGLKTLKQASARRLRVSWQGMKESIRANSPDKSA